MLTVHPKPDVTGGIDYWQSVEANVNGVLGGYGLGTLPRVDALGSRLFLLGLLPRLSTIPDVTQDPKLWRDKRGTKRRTLALDAGAGVGRVTRDVLSLLLDEVHLVEPVRKFLAAAAAEAPTWPSLQSSSSLSTSQQRPKSVHFHISTLHALDPARPWSTSDGGIFLPSSVGKTSSGPSAVGRNNKRVRTEGQSKIRGGSPIPPVFAGGARADLQSSAAGNSDVAPHALPDSGTSTAASPASSEEEPLKYDVIWCQWMLQHLSDQDLIAFLHRAKACLVVDDESTSSDAAAASASASGGSDDEDHQRRQDGLIVVKENVCSELEDGSENVWWDEEDKSITRSALAYERVFRQAGLSVVKCEVQQGLPEELFVVKMWALR